MKNLCANNIAYTSRTENKISKRVNTDNTDSTVLFYYILNDILLRLQKGLGIGDGHIENML